MKGISQYTCVRFVARTAENDYLDFQHTLTGCNSWVGRVGGGQRVSIMTDNGSGGTCLRKGIIQHEILHALGFDHMQSSFDRDQFVKINFANVKVIDGQNMSYNFDLEQNQRNNTPYDWKSLMHYGAYDFSIEPGVKPVIEPLDPSIPLSALGQRVGLTTGDYLRLSRLYNCWR